MTLLPTPPNPTPLLITVELFETYPHHEDPESNPLSRSLGLGYRSINETSHGHGRRKVNHLFEITRYGMAVALKAIT